jgi:uncharacterized RDD family membrane protein YckC
MTVLAPSAPVARAQPLYAGFWIRVLAFLIDSVVIGLIVGFATAGRPWPITGETWLAYANWHNFMETFIGLAYFTITWSSITGGQTLGMRALGLRVVGRDMAPIGLGTALVRWVGIVISAAVLLIGLIWVAFDSRKQGWHDKIAGTFVVATDERVGEG